MKEEEESCFSAHCDSEDRGVVNNPTVVAGNLEFNSDVALWIKQVEETDDNSHYGESVNSSTSVANMYGVLLPDNDLQLTSEIKEAQNTKTVIKSSLSVFKDYLRAKQLDYQLVEEYDSRQLSCLLCEFYAHLRKPNGDYYAKTSITTFRYGLQKHFLQMKGVDIVHDPAFKNANTVMAAMFKKLKRVGKGKVQHKEPLSMEDFQKLYGSCDLNTPAGLQHKVFIDLMLHLCNRGSDKLRDFHKEEFQIAIDSLGHKYVAKSSQLLLRSPSGEKAANEGIGPRMYELKGNTKCPVMSFEKYLLKLHPGHSAFWQRPKPSAPPEPGAWYNGVPVGKDTLGKYMKMLSRKYGLSKIYTNYCLRVTCLAVLDVYTSDVIQPRRLWQPEDEEWSSG
ncbi:uncharacterized protein LOC115094356 [Rhinatrema bivittatum]|uniref:uncharacterized protein LOC115094356 n=1 Tax=Rhinatrema bivittatum TaxID=194408 RepID=UPI00112BC196|nr:uncharacterized protein LOC115094356 [Rhinatrema bivittatum]